MENEASAREGQLSEEEKPGAVNITGVPERQPTEARPAPAPLAICLCLSQSVLGFCLLQLKEQLTGAGESYSPFLLSWVNCLRARMVFVGIHQW